MMKKKRRKPIEFKPNKSLKPTPIDVPPPYSTSIINNKSIFYNFLEPKKAKIFLQALQNQNIFPMEFTMADSVLLTQSQFDAWLGRGSYYKIYTINHYIQYNQFHRIELGDIEPALANQVALLLNHIKCDIFFLTLIDKEKFPSWKLSSFIQVLSRETIQQIAQNEHFKLHNGLGRCMHNLDPESALLFLNQLPNDLCNTLVLQKDSSGNTPLIYAALYQPPQVFAALLNKLNSDTLNLAALQNDENGNSFLSSAAMAYPPHILADVISRLTPATCNKMTFLGDITNNILSVLGVWQPEEVYKLFEEKLTLSTKMQHLFPERMNEYDSDGCLPHIGCADWAAGKAAVKLVSSAFQSPQELHKYATKKSQLSEIQLYDGGASLDAWSDFALGMITRAPVVNKRRAKLDLSNKLSETTKSQHPNRQYLNELNKTDWKYLRTQGRTILLENEKKQIRAVKIKKQNESIYDLRKEYDTTKFLRQNAEKLGLKSQLPNPVIVTEVSDLYRWLNSWLPTSDFLAIQNTLPFEMFKSVYVYDVDPKTCDYFTYLHDIRLSDQAFNEANRTSVHDLFTLLKMGVVFPQLGDIFHNLEHVNLRSDHGRYMVLVNLLRDFGFKGSGRLTRWKEAVEYPNLRASGIADLGDRDSINDYIYDGKKLENFYLEAKKLYGHKAPNYVLANIMAEYQFILFLIAGRRGCELTEAAKKTNASEVEIHLIWQKLAEQIMDNCIQATVLLTNEKESEIKKILNALVDVNRLATQMQYWMTTQYIEDLKNNRVKEGIYEPGTDITVDMDRFRANTFNPKLGCSIDGVHQDLGPVNGQEPIKEANKLFYWMVTKVFQTYNLLHMTVKDLKKVTDEKDIQKSESLRKNLFTHMPEKQYHKLQHVLCEERLKQHNLPAEVKTQITSESTHHKNAYAAFTIQNFWRNYRKPKNDMNEVKKMTPF